MSDENEIKFEYDMDALIKAASSGETSAPLATHTITMQFEPSRRLPIAEAAEMLANAVADLGAKVEVMPGMVVDDGDELKPGYHILFAGEFGEFETAFVTDEPFMTKGEYHLTMQAARAAIAFLIEMTGGADGHE